MHGGFSSIEPWLPVGEANLKRDVRTQMEDPDSTLNFYRDLLQFRRASRALLSGSFRMLNTGGDDYLLFERRAEGEHLLIAVNFGPEIHRLKVPAKSNVVFMTGQTTENALGPFEGKIFRIGCN